MSGIPQADIKKKVISPSERIEDLEKRQKQHENLIYLVVIVLFVGFILALIGTGAILENYLAAKQATYEDLKDQVVKLTDDVCNQKGATCQ